MNDPQDAGAMPDTDEAMDPQDAGGQPEDESDDDSPSGVIHLSADMLPEGMAAKVKKGDVFKFTAMGPMDEEGDIPLTCDACKKDAGGPDAEGSDSWENDFKKAMSPRNPEPVPNGMNGGY